MCEKTMIKPVERIKLKMIITSEIKARKKEYLTAPELLLDLVRFFFYFLF